MNNYRQLAPGAYMVAFLLFVIPFFDAILGLAPFNLGSSQWRFGAFGLLSNALMLPASGALIAVATAVILGHTRAQRAFSIISWLAVVTILVSTVLFSLDAIQSRRLIRPDMQLSYFVATGTAVGKLLLGGLAFLFFARGSRSDRIISRESAGPVTGSFRKRDLASF